MGQHANERNFDIAMQHLQVDHFIDGGELPVVLNRRFLHINSRWLREKAVQLTARWITGSHIIKKFSVSMVPYWLNLELGVLIRLLDLAESMGFNEASPDEGVRVPLEPPQQPSSLADAKHMEVWRLETLVVEPLRLTIMVRSPDIAAARDNTMARRIRFLPVDMPNMDLKVDQTVLTNQFGSIQQILGTLGSLYKRKARNSALLSVMLSYMAAILKGSMNALWWLARGPYDALDAANQSEGERDWFFWVDPFVQGLSEGTYRAFAELVGNALFGVVLILNSLRQVILGVPRPRAQSFLDGILQGFYGLVVDTFLTPMRQLVLQTQIAYHDWGILRASVVFCLCLLRVFLGPALGALHLAASVLEGLANLLLHEEAQFAPFEMQRAPEPEAAHTMTGVPSALAGAANSQVAPFQSTTYSGPPWDAAAAATTPPAQASTATRNIAGGRTPPSNSLGTKSLASPVTPLAAPVTPVVLPPGDGRLVNSNHLFDPSIFPDLTGLYSPPCSPFTPPGTPPAGPAGEGRFFSFEFPPPLRSTFVDLTGTPELALREGSYNPNGLKFGLSYVLWQVLLSRLALRPLPALRLLVRKINVDVRTL
eukprot:symbB.v1.2.000283.t1/scaffold23.1/size449444/10